MYPGYQAKIPRMSVEISTDGYVACLYLTPVVVFPLVQVFHNVHDLPQLQASSIPPAHVS